MRTEENSVRFFSHEPVRKEKKQKTGEDIFQN